MTIDLVTLLMDSGALYINGGVYHADFYPNSDLFDHAMDGEQVPKAEAIWKALDPEDLPRWVAEHTIPELGTSEWTQSSYSDDMVTYAAQLYLEGGL